MADREYLFPLWIRIWHWTNATLIICLIVTGASMHFSGPSRKITFDLARDVHNICGVALCVVWLAFVIGNLVTGNWRQFVPRRAGLAHRAWLQLRYYVWGLFRGEPRPFPSTRSATFNPLQQIFYWAIIYAVMPVLLASGVVFLWPGLVPGTWFGVDALVPIAIIHFIAGFIILSFLVAHIYLGTLGATPLSDFKAMITGWEEEERRTNSRQ